LEVTTSHDRGTSLFWLISQPFTLVARVGEGAQDHNYEWIKGLMNPMGALGAGGPKIGRQYRPQQGNLLFRLISRPFTIVARVGEGARDHSYERIKSHMSPVGTLGAGGPKIGRHYRPQQGNLLFWLLSRPFTLVAREGKGARTHSYKWIKGRISTVDTLKAGGLKIGRHYQPKQGNFVVSVNFTTFHACCSGGGRRPRSQL
jgi:hypothetical protein